MNGSSMILPVHPFQIFHPISAEVTHLIVQMLGPEMPEKALMLSKLFATLKADVRFLSRPDMLLVLFVLGLYN